MPSGGGAGVLRDGCAHRTWNNQHVSTWVATGFGALDLRATREVEADFAVVSTLPAEPIGISGDVGSLWRRLVDGPVDDAALSAKQRALVREFAEFGIASQVMDHPARIRSVPAPWFVSFTHELVCALVASVARGVGVRVIFIKGPTLRSQGLRDREHSGDVDAWVEPARLAELSAALLPWGWTVQPDLWSGTPVNHSVTLRPSAWGCEIDLHRHFPGIALSERAAFEEVAVHCEAVSFAGVEGQVPDRPTHAVIGALHLARPEVGIGQVSGKLNAAVATLRSGGVGAADVAQNLHAEAALGRVLVQAFPGRTFNANDELPLNWRWRQQPSKAAAYIVALRGVPWRQRPRLLVRTVWPPRDAALASDAMAAGTASSVIIARLRRLKRGLGQLFEPPE